MGYRRQPSDSEPQSIDYALISGRDFLLSTAQECRLGREFDLLSGGKLHRERWEVLDSMERNASPCFGAVEVSGVPVSFLDGIGIPYEGGGNSRRLPYFGGVLMLYFNDLCLMLRI